MMRRPAMAGLCSLVSSLGTSTRHIASGADTSSCKVKEGLTRNPSFKRFGPEDEQFFRGVLPEPGGVITDPAELQGHNLDWFQHYHGQGPVCLFPKTTAQVAEILRYCNAHKLAVVPQGGNTNFVGGAVPVFDEIILNLRKLNKVLQVDEVSSTLTCQAGCILEPTDAMLKSTHHLMLPVDLGAKGSCMLGGNVSTNAGGIRYMRYGSLHNNVIGLEVVLASGEVLDMLDPRKKDNTGYDLKHVFIGSEGTLGVVTALSLQLPPAPKSVQTMLLGLGDWDKLIQTYRFSKEALGEILSAVEMIDGDALDLVVRVNKTHSPLASPHRYYLLLETNGCNASHDKDKLDGFLSETLDKGLVEDGTLAASGAQAKHIWSIREGCAIAPNELGHVRWYDLSMPTPEMDRLITQCRGVLKAHGFGKDVAEVIAFGHLGDGNLHTNVVSKPHYLKEVFDVIDPFIYGYGQQHNYSVSAEHGIGVQKLPYLGYSKPTVAVRLMKGMKQLYDPNGILNPYKVLPAEPLA